MPWWEKILFLVYFACECNPLFATYDIIQWPVLLILAGRFVQLMLKKGLRLTTYIGWFGVVYFFSLLSVIWALNAQFVLSDAINTIKTFIVLSYVSMLIDSVDDIIKLIDLYVAAATISAAFIIRYLDISNLSSGRLEIIVQGSVWNLNYVANMQMTGAFLAAVLLVYRKKAGYLLPMLLMAAVVVLTGSRQGIMNLCISIVVLLILGTQKRRFIKLLVILLTIFLAYEAMITIPWLYEVAGARIESLLTNTMTDSVMTSNTARVNMIKYGWEWFLQSPIFGYGAANYRVLYYSNYGSLRYAHNNYIEVLVGGGIIGFMLYYYVYVKILARGLSQIHTRNVWKVLPFILIISTMMADMVVVTKGFFNNQLYICIAMCLMEKCNTQQVLYKKRYVW